MKILILEDNQSKAKDIKETILTEYPNSEIKIVSSFNLGMQILLKEDWDWAILDNTMPRFSDSDISINNNCAEDALTYLYLEEKNIKCIICSAFDNQVDEEQFQNLCKEHSICIDYLKYSVSKIDWKNKLINLLK